MNFRFDRQSDCDQLPVVKLVVTQLPEPLFLAQALKIFIDRDGRHLRKNFIDDNFVFSHLNDDTSLPSSKKQLPLDFIIPIQTGCISFPYWRCRNCFQVLDYVYFIRYNDDQYCISTTAESAVTICSETSLSLFVLRCNQK